MFAICDDNADNMSLKSGLNSVWFLEFPCHQCQRPDHQDAICRSCVEHTDIFALLGERRTFSNRSIHAKYGRHGFTRIQSLNKKSLPATQESGHGPIAACHRHHSLVIVSSRFRIRFAIMVMAAKPAGSSPATRGDAPMTSSFSASAG